MLSLKGVCHEDQDKLMKALDAAVILMEGGSQHDLTILDGRDRNSDKPLVAIPVAKLKKEQPPTPVKEENDSDSEEGDIKEEGECQSYNYTFGCLFLSVCFCLFVFV